MKKICAKGEVVRGIDIYHGDLIGDINQVKTGAVYAFLKAFEYSADSRFAPRWKAMKTAGIIRGAYDFFHPSRPALAQATAFLNLVGTLEPDDLPCVLDWESSDGMPSGKDRDAGFEWLTTVENATKKTPIIYGAPYFLQALALDSRFARFPLWVAHYGVVCPLVPEPWKTWTFWQGSENNSVPGMIGHCDTDVFNGSLDDLKKFIAKSSVR